jgi:hypothetical protein
LRNSRTIILLFGFVVSFFSANTYASSTTQTAELQPANLATSIDLIDYVKTHALTVNIDQLAVDHPGYNRAKDFGGWINENPDNCYDVRNEVLIRDADPKKPIVFTRADKCKVSKAVWHEVYTGTDYRTAASVQIDHVVPLKHAYLTGAYAWRPSKRCTYANFLADDFHLLAVSGHENMSKGDHAPDLYLPPSKKFLCQYLADWMKVKVIWQLVTTPTEVEAIQATATAQNCSAAMLSISSDDLDILRRKAELPPKACINFETALAATPGPNPLPTSFR